jgi:sulfite reductase alpha subunit-like flavoprotein
MMRDLLFYVLFSMEDDWKKWKSQFWTSAVKHYFGTAVNSNAASSFSPSFRLVLGSDHSSDTAIANRNFKSRRSSSSTESAPFSARVLTNRELRNLQADPSKLKDTTSTIHIELDISDTGLTYRTAENLGIFSHNDYKLVARLAKRLGFDLNQEFRLQPLNAEDGK